MEYLSVSPSLPLKPVIVTLSFKQIHLKKERGDFGLLQDKVVTGWPLSREQEGILETVVHVQCLAGPLGVAPLMLKSHVESERLWTGVCMDDLHFLPSIFIFE